MPAFATGLREKFRTLAAYARDARMLLSNRRNPWPGGKPTFAYKIDRFIFYVAAFGFLSCLVSAFTGSPPSGAVFACFNAVNAWMNLRGMLQEKFKAYLGKVLDSSDGAEDPYSKAAIKFAVAWPLLELERKFYENVQTAVRGLYPKSARTPEFVYSELVHMAKRGRI